MLTEQNSNQPTAHGVLLRHKPQWTHPGKRPYAMSEHFATIRWQHGEHPFVKGRYSRKHE
jgi:hypothetical protein